MNIVLRGNRGKIQKKCLHDLRVQAKKAIKLHKLVMRKVSSLMMNRSSNFRRSHDWIILSMIYRKKFWLLTMIYMNFVRLFFEACGFGDDILGSTTMMYTKTVATQDGADHMVRRVGRKLLLVPPLKEPWPCLKPISSKS